MATTAKVSHTVSVVKTSTVLDTNDVRLTGTHPADAAPIEFADGTGIGQCTKIGFGYVDLAGSAATIDLTAVSGMTAWQGDTAFAAIKVLKVFNNEATSTSETLAVGDAASVPFDGPLSGTDPKYTVYPGCPMIWMNRSAAGWDCSTNKNLKLDPGANSFRAYVLIAGE